jgi:cell division protein ZapA
MPDVTIAIGGREFSVSCQEGEEHYLKAAASMLDREAEALNAQIGRLPEARMLLMAGLMLGDKTAGIEDQVKAAQARVAELEAALAEATTQPAPEPERVEVPVIPDSVSDALAEIAARAEALAAKVEEDAAS